MRVGGQPDMDGTFAGRKVTPETLAELRSCIRAGAPFSSGTRSKNTPRRTPPGAVSTSTSTTTK